MIDKIEGEINNALAHLASIRAEFQADLDEALEQVAQLKAGIARIDKVVKAAEAQDANGSRPGPKPGKGKGKFKMNRKGGDIVATPMTLERSEQILRIMRNNPKKEDWTAKEVVEASGINSSGVNVALTFMRQESMIRPTRTVQGGGYAYAPYPE